MEDSASKSALILGKVWPEPSSSAAGYRLLQLIDMVKNAGYTVVFSSVAVKSEYSVDLAALGISEIHIEMNSDSFDDFVRQLNPYVVLFDRFMTEEQFGWRVAEQCPNALRVLDTEDLHFLRESRKTALQNGERWTASHLYNDATMRELASMYRCDLNIIISDYEIELLTTKLQFPRKLLFYLPFLVDDNALPKPQSWRTYTDRAHFVSIGNFWHAPNWDSVLFLKKEVWPLIRAQLPKAELHIYGAYASQKVWQLHNQAEGFMIKGRADDALKTISSYRVLLAPLRFGAGLKGKFLDAMLTGTPSVSTEIGAEGMAEIDAWPGGISKDPSQLAKLASDLYENSEDWKNAQRKIPNLLDSRFKRTRFEATFVQAISALCSNLPAHRAGNVVGRILEHQSLRATKYMSKWIEEKNR